MYNVQRQKITCHIRTKKALIKLRICAVWSGPSLFVDISFINQWYCRKALNALIRLQASSDLVLRCLHMHEGPFRTLSGIPRYDHVTRKNIVYSKLTRRKQNGVHQCKMVCSDFFSIQNHNCSRRHFLLLLFIENKKKKIKKRNTTANLFMYSDED